MKEYSFATFLHMIFLRKKWSAGRTNLSDQLTTLLFWDEPRGAGSEVTQKTQKEGCSGKTQNASEEEGRGKAETQKGPEFR